MDKMIIFDTNLSKHMQCILQNGNVIISISSLCGCILCQLILDTKQNEIAIFC